MESSREPRWLLLGILLLTGAFFGMGVGVIWVVLR